MYFFGYKTRQSSSSETRAAQLVSTCQRSCNRHNNIVYNHTPALHPLHSTYNLLRDLRMVDFTLLINLYPTSSQGTKDIEACALQADILKKQQTCPQIQKVRGNFSEALISSSVPWRNTLRIIAFLLLFQWAQCQHTEVNLINNYLLLMLKTAFSLNGHFVRDKHSYLGLAFCKSYIH